MPEGKRAGSGTIFPFFVPADLPAIIDNNILVASLFPAVASHRIGHRLNQIFAEVAGKLVKLFQPMGEVAARVSRSD